MFETLYGAQSRTTKPFLSGEGGHRTAVRARFPPKKEPGSSSYSLGDERNVGRRLVAVGVDRDHVNLVGLPLDEQVLRNEQLLRATPGPWSSTA
jgi:hypothetical protein